MTIKVYEDRIEFNNIILSTTPTGISVSDNLVARSFDRYTQAQGQTNGYVSGGAINSSSFIQAIDRFPLTADTVGSASSGNLSASARGMVAGQSSSTHGYTSGGYIPSPPSLTASNIIDRFPFASGGNATDVGDMTVARAYVSGQSSTSHGYTAGGYDTSFAQRNIIDRFPFASTGNASDVGDLTSNKTMTAGHSSLTHGYVTGGLPLAINSVNKYPFSVSSTNSTDVANLNTMANRMSGISSSTHAYTAGGAPLFLTVIEKFPFATDSNSTSVGSLSRSTRDSAGISSIAHGFVAGGYNGPARTDRIDRFPFATDTNSTNVGTIASATKFAMAGQQV